MLKIPFSPPDITEAEITEVAEAMRSGWITTGSRTKELEHRLADFIGVNRTVCLNSATAALEMTFRVLGIGKGDEVITSAYTYTFNAVKLADIKFLSLYLNEFENEQFRKSFIKKYKAYPTKKLVIPTRTNTTFGTKGFSSYKSVFFSITSLSFLCFNFII